VKTWIKIFLASGFWLLASGFWLLASGFWLLASGFWLLASGLLLSSLFFLVDYSTTHAAGRQYKKNKKLAMKGEKRRKEEVGSG
jgi:predicted tellurium resistance membrane protein TerC